MCLFTILRWVINALLLVVITYLVPGVYVQNFYYALLTVAVLGLVNALIRPVIILLTLPVNILTLGLFTLVINGFMFWLVASILEGFSVANFWAALIGALIYALLSMLVSYLEGNRSQ